MAITRTTDGVQIHIGEDGGIANVRLQCRCVFDADPDNPGMAPPEMGERFVWSYADLTTDEQTAVVTLLNAMTARMDADHPINSGS